MPVPGGPARPAHAGQGAVVFTGCSHAGLVNVVEHMTRVAGGPVFAVVGGACACVCVCVCVCTYVCVYVCVCIERVTGVTFC